VSCSKYLLILLRSARQERPLRTGSAVTGGLRVLAGAGVFG
jgi:hypothetical protein